MHDLFGFGFHVWVVAVDFAFVAGAFLFLEGAFVES